MPSGRGTLRIYLGPAPGVGKTFAMLEEGRRRRERGTDVVVGVAETHGRAGTAAKLRDLEVIPRRVIIYRDTRFEELDTEAVIGRKPQVALIDELAHTNVPGSRNAKRWQDVEQILDAGIDVITTLNVQHLESVNDVIETITGVPQRETIPDAVVRAADQLELVDMSPEALRRRLAHGNVYPAEKVDAALANYFRPGNLGALREIALLWTADRVDEALQRYRAQHGIDQPWETRERIVVAMTGAKGGDTLIRRAARTAMRTHGELVGIHVSPVDGLTADATGELATQRALLGELGGTYREVAGSDVAEALVAAARAENATRLVLGSSRRSRLQEWIHGSVVNRVVRLSTGQFDVAVIARQDEPQPELPRRRRPPSLPVRRRIAGLVVAAVAIPVLTTVLVNAGSAVSLSTALLLYTALVVAVATIGGLWPAVPSAIGSFVAANWYFTPPVRTLRIGNTDDLLALLVFVAVAVTVSGLVELAARRAAEGASARAEAETIARLTGVPPVPSLLDGLVRALRLDGAAVLHTAGDAWTVESEAGDGPHDPSTAEQTLSLGRDYLLAIHGSVTAGDARILEAFARELSASLERGALERGAAQAEQLARAGDLRSALLAAVSHDLRTPLAAIRAAVTSLMEDDVVWSREQIDEFYEAIDTEAERLDALLGNLLDMSRIQSGAITLTERAVSLDEVMPVALAGLGAIAADVHVDVSESLPPVQADAGLLERVLANLIVNALTHSPVGRPVRVIGGAVDGVVEIRVIDRGPGIPADDRDRVFEPFRRLGDARAGAGGVGLGLAVAKGFIEAMHGSIEVEDTPGGGATMVVTLRRAA